MYEALYRKYRPRTFDEVVGQDFITGTLKNQVMTGRLSHAYLFIGTRGTGKTTCARILAKAVNCEHPENGNPCNRCAACRGIDDGSVLDIVEIDAASNNSVEDVRMLREEAVFSPTTVRRRVYIIDEVHMLSKNAFNALLKILEEPPAHLMFILATTELNKVLPTILSRCQRHSFRRLDPDTIAARLSYVAEQEGIRLEPAAARLLGRLADGGMRDGLSLLDQCSAADTVDETAVLNAMGLAGSFHICELAETIRRGDVASALERYEALWQDGKDPMSLLGELAAFFRDSLLLRLAPRGGQGLLSGAFTESALLSREGGEADLLRCLNIIRKYQSAPGLSNPRLQGELCIIELCMPRQEAFLSPASATGRERTRPVERPRPAVSAGTGTDPDRKISAEGSEEAVSPDPAKAEKDEPAPPEPENPPEPDRAEEPVPRTENGSAAVSWADILREMKNELPVGTYFNLLDPTQIRGIVTESALILQATDFVGATVNSPNVINRFRQCVSRLAGRPMEVRMEPMSDAQDREEKLDRLMEKFGNVTIQ